MALFSPITFDDNGTYYVSGQLPADVSASLEEQTSSSLERIEAVLAEHGLDRSSMRKLCVFTTRIDEIAHINNAYGAFFEGAETMPARSAFGVTGLVGGALVEIDCVGTRA
ncbi:RidA family protein [Thermophilibacter sp.]